GAGEEGAGGEAELDERGVKEIARIVAGERPPSPVRALQPRREADDQQPRIERSERGDRRIEPFGLPGPPTLAKRNEPRTPAAVTADFRAVAHRKLPMNVGAEPARLIVLELVIIGRGRGNGRPRRCAALEELRRVPRLPRLTRGAVTGIAADFRLQVSYVEEDVGLPTQFVGDHRRLRRHPRGDGAAHAAPLPPLA